jgi:hypothetical protein
MLSKTSHRPPRLDNAYHVFFEKKSALATGLGAAALALTPGNLAGANDPEHLMPLLTSEWRASSLREECVIDAGHTSQASAPETPVLLPYIEEEWTDAQQKRFQELAVDEAVGTLGPDETVELEQLTLRRRVLQSPRSGSEILWEFEQRRRTHDLLKILRRYVEFYEGTNSTGKRPGKSPN